MSTSSPTAGSGWSWESVVAEYTDLVTHLGFEYQKPMVAVSAALAQRTARTPVYPFMSHESLCIGLHADYDPQQPFFSLTLKRDGLLHFALWRSVGDLVDSSHHAVGDALPAFDSYLERLRAGSG